MSRSRFFCSRGNRCIFRGRCYRIFDRYRFRFFSDNFFFYIVYLFMVYKVKVKEDIRKEFRCFYCEFIILFGYRFKIYFNGYKNIR